ncbi:MAG: divalent-cation tolerance protein CutA [Sedimenticolaceae bacterium]|nr:divalent-cation tolerance protein CutA [Sedimenticolaceae bacterium]
MKLLVYCTCPDRVTAGKLASELVERSLAACVNILPGVESVYRWQGVIERSDEILLLIKSDTAHFGALEDTISNLHPYEVPEILAVPVEAGHQPYLEWIDQCLEDS